MESEKPVSIRDVAEIAGVSISTVSRVVNNTGRFSEATRARVQKVIEETGYVANAAAKNLREQRSKTVGVIVPDISNDFFSMLTLHVERFLAEAGYSVFICNSGSDPARERSYLKTLASKQVDGIICINGKHELQEDALPKGIPLVCIDRYLASGRIPRVVSDDVAGTRMATEHLIERGCTAILYLSRAEGHSDLRHREQGYRQALEAHGLAFDPAYLLHPQGLGPSRIEAEQLMNGFLERGLPFDGVVCVSDHAAAGVLEALRAHGVSVPDQVKLVGYDDSVYAQTAVPKLTSIHRFPQQLAQKGCEVLLQSIAGQAPPLLNVVPVELVVRESSGGRS